MIVMFTDFGLEGPYVGQMEAVLHHQVPGAKVINLFADAPRCNPMASSYLLAAYATTFPAGCIFLCVVDPGVGSKQRAALLEADGRWYVGPDNGLLNTVILRSREVKWWDISWRPEKPEQLSNSFHGRDLYAPIAAMLEKGEMPAGESRLVQTRVRVNMPEELYEIIYIDHYGNAITGIQAASFSGKEILQINGQLFLHANTFSDVDEGKGMWYENANGLVEIAVNKHPASEMFGLKVGDKVTK
jgi:S-adenosylmethionine hydrolase